MALKTVHVGKCLLVFLPQANFPCVMCCRNREFCDSGTFSARTHVILDNVISFHIPDRPFIFLNGNLKAKIIIAKVFL